MARSSPSSSAVNDAPAAKKQRTAGAADAKERHVVPVIGGSVVYIGHGLLTSIPAEITQPAAGIKASRYVIVSDRTVFGKFFSRRSKSYFCRSTDAVGEKRGTDRIRDLLSCEVD